MPKQRNPHLTKFGKPKEGLGEELARQRALRLTEEQQEIFDAYLCHCDEWHVGHVQSTMDKYAGRMLFNLWPELGERACACLRAENTRSRDKRDQSITKRWQSSKFVRLRIAAAYKSPMVTTP